MTDTNVPAAGSNLAPVTDTLAQILHALTLGASVTFTFPPGTTNSNPNGASVVAPGNQAPVSATSTTTTVPAAAPAPTAPATTNVPSVAVGTATSPGVANATPTATNATPTATNATPTATNAANVAPAPAVVAAPVVMNQDAIVAGAMGADVADATDEKYYVVTVGRRIGVFVSWNRTSPYVVGASGCTYSCVGHGIGTRDKAIRAFNEAFEAGECHVVP
ncbi:hypothetical protein H0H93_010407 [Arthromyces matolae]|nr:hypothetical protein H0H93_010407 [Arthromyces matolae]